MGRHFTKASSNKITLSLGAGGSITGAVTLAAIVNNTAGSNAIASGVISIGSGGATDRKMVIAASTRKLTMISNGLTSTSTTVVASEWQFIAATKAAGTATPRFHFYTFSSGAWTHESGSNSVQDSSPTGASGIGYVPTSNDRFFEGDIAIAGAWKAVLTDAQVETLAFSLVPWHSYSNNGLWVLDQADTTIKVWDQSGNGANESVLTGTSVATTAVPMWNRGAPITTVNQPPYLNLVTTGSLVLTSS